MSIRERRRKLGRIGVSLVAVASMSLTLVSVAAASTKAQAKPHATSGGTAYFAEGAQAAPNYIFPFEPIQFFSVTNLSQFQFLMFRPLYWFGTGDQPTLNPSLSLAEQPTYTNHNKTVTITMKNYKWSDGESVTATDVRFWMNMLKVEKANWAGYAPGTLPDDVASLVVNSPTKLTITLTGSVNPYWFTYNELSQLTPLPLAWDVTSASQKAGTEACATSTYAEVTVTAKGAPVSAAAKSCAAVFTYLSTQAGFNPSNPKAANNSLNTYATNPLWQVVDGPWKLKAFNASGLATFVPNTSYSGPVKPRLAQFVEEPYTSNAAEFNALVGGKLTVGFLPPEDVTAQAKSPLVPGPNNPQLKNWTLLPQYPWGINYFPYNMTSTGDGGQAGKIFSQLYFRQAMQSLIPETTYIDKIYKGYAVPTYGPVPVIPKNKFASSYEEKAPYPYNPSKAKQLLTSNGWVVKPGGVSYCGKTTCTGGIPKGTKLEFTEQYYDPGPTQTTLNEDEASSWDSVGIKVNLTTATFDTIIGNATPCKGSGCTWELENWGGGWNYAPDYYPTGEEIFQTGAGSNVGSYSNPTNDAMIKATDFTNTPLTNWENYFAKEAPVVFQPAPAFELIEVSPKIKGVAPVNPLLTINPENWYFTS